MADLEASTREVVSAKTDRRGCLRSAARWAGLAALALLVWRLGGRSWHKGAAVDHTCTGGGSCPNCSRASTCGLPQALSARRIGRGR